MDLDTLTSVAKGAVALLDGNKRVLAYEHVGSSSLKWDDKQPPKDIDFLVYVDPRYVMDALDIVAMFPYFKTCSGDYSEADAKVHWAALRRGLVNLIVTSDYDWYIGSHRSNDVCKLLNIRDKRTRVSVFKLIRDGGTPEEAQAAANLAIIL